MGPTLLNIYELSTREVAAEIGATCLKLCTLTAKTVCMHKPNMHVHSFSQINKITCTPESVL